MIYDCFTFFNELDLLEIRLNILKDVVDKFVLVEAGETHTGKPKPLYFKENESRFAEFKDRIVYVGIDKFPAGHDAWWNENYQRNMILEGLVGASPDDVVMISDMDEFPRPEVVACVAKKKGVWRFNHVSYGFYLNFIDLRCRNMCGTKLLSYHDLTTGFDGVETNYNEFLPKDLNDGTTVTKIRRRPFPACRGGERLLKNAGWHFTCLGGAKALLTKMRAVAPHHDFDPDDTSLTVAKIEALLAKGQGPALKMNCFGVPLDETFPVYIREHQGRYAHLIFRLTPEYMRRVRWARRFRMVQGRLIQFCEWAMPSRLHDFLHVVRMGLLSRRLQAPSR